MTNNVSRHGFCSLFLCEIQLFNFAFKCTVWAERRPKKNRSECSPISYVSSSWISIFRKFIYREKEHFERCLGRIPIRPIDCHHGSKRCRQVVAAEHFDWLYVSWHTLIYSVHQFQISNKDLCAWYRRILLSFQLFLYAEKVALADRYTWMTSNWAIRNMPRSAATFCKTTICIHRLLCTRRWCWRPIWKSLTWRSTKKA